MKYSRRKAIFEHMEWKWINK